MNESKHPNVDRIINKKAVRFGTPSGCKPSSAPIFPQSWDADMHLQVDGARMHG